MAQSPTPNWIGEMIWLVLAIASSFLLVAILIVWSCVVIIGQLVWGLEEAYINYKDKRSK